MPKLRGNPRLSTACANAYTSRGERVWRDKKRFYFSVLCVPCKKYLSTLLRLVGLRLVYADWPLTADRHAAICSFCAESNSVASIELCTEDRQMRSGLFEGPSLWLQVYRNKGVPGWEWIRGKPLKYFPMCAHR